MKKFVKFEFSIYAFDHTFNTSTMSYGVYTTVKPSAVLSI